MNHDLLMLSTSARRRARGLLLLALCFLGMGSLHVWHAVDVAVHENETACEVCLSLASNNNATLSASDLEFVALQDVAAATAPITPLIRAATKGVAIRAPPVLMN